MGCQMLLTVRLGCHHDTIQVKRMHADCVEEKDKSKVLYIDVHGCWNFAQCSHCKKLLKTKLLGKIYGAKEWP